jgi:hypothetical protein
VCIGVRGIGFVVVSTIFLLDFETVLAGPASSKLDQLLQIAPRALSTFDFSSTHNSTLQVLQRTAVGPRTSQGRHEFWCVVVLYFLFWFSFY